MEKAVFMVHPSPESHHGKDSFSIDLLPEPGAAKTGDGLVFNNAVGVRMFLAQLHAEDSLKAGWSDSLERCEPFTIHSSYEEWRRIGEWLSQNMYE